MKERYNSIDGLRAIACIGIVLMHMQANNHYNLLSNAVMTGIGYCTNFVFLFMTISAFGLCCGYYEKMASGKLDLASFYKKRYMNIMPIFICLIVIDLIFSFSFNSVFEALANISLTFGLFPNDIKVIGVGWFLGLVFAFYMIFPFFCVLIQNKKRAWMFFALSIGLNALCKYYFNVDRRNIVFSFCFFMLGGLLYLYREKISNFKWYISLSILVVSIIVSILLKSNVYSWLLFSGALMIFAISDKSKLLNNKVTSFISGISLEIYLSHMAVFQLIKKLGLNKIIDNDVVQYIVTSLIVLIGAIVFSVVFKKAYAFLLKIIKDRKNKKQIA